ncbi:hypothetical protein EXT67_20815 [Pectobacterium atrosepticum]|nr:hypothetical protein [Pectobacterium atrosepticum]MCL6318745.1 hypothetical protein [Pectobacterium atrosepticum]
MDIEEAMSRYGGILGKFELVGVGRNSRGRPQLFVKCPACSYDEYVAVGVCTGVFKVTPPNLKGGAIPCRCSKRFNWSEEQSEYRVKRVLEERGQSFVEWGENDKSPMYRGVVANCPRHGNFETTLCRIVNQGQFCPSCSGHSQLYGYLNFVMRDGIPIAAKFGITADLRVRLRGQNKRNRLRMKKAFSWVFEDVPACKAAEQKCKRSVPTAFLSKVEMVDGYTETIALHDVDAVINIMSETGKPLK